MSDPRAGEGGTGQDPSEATPVEPVGVSGTGARPSTFSLEGRAAPALYLSGWLASVLGLGIAAVGILGGVGPLFVLGLILLGVGLLAATGSQAVDRARRTDLAYRGPSPWLAFAAVIPLSLVLQILLVFAFRAVGVELSPAVLTAILLAITALTYGAVVRLLVIGTGSLDWHELGLRLPARRVVTDLVYGGAFGLPVLFVTGFLALALSQVLHAPATPLPEARSAVDIVANLLTAAVIAPIGEELFFRGYATTAWARSMGPRAAIIRGALFFALAHVITLGDQDLGLALQGALFAFVVRLPVGLTLGWLFLARRSLPASIGLHAVFNGIQVILLASAAT